MKRNKKNRGISLTELIVSLALLGVLVGILGPTLRFFTRLTNRYDYGINSITNIGAAEQFMEKQISMTNLANSLTANSSYKVNTGIIIGDINGPYPTNSDELVFGINVANGNSKVDFIDFPNKPGNNKGNAVFFELPVVYNNPQNPDDIKNNKITLPAFGVFRFVTAKDPITGEWNTVLTYTTTYDPIDYSHDYIAALGNANSVIPWISEVQILPPTIGKIKLVPNHSDPNLDGDVSEVSTMHSVKTQSGTVMLNNLNYFQFIPGGIKVHFTYYPDPNNLNIMAVGERIFLKRGEI